MLYFFIPFYGLAADRQEYCFTKDYLFILFYLFIYFLVKITIIV